MPVSVRWRLAAEATTTAAAQMPALGTPLAPVAVSAMELGPPDWDGEELFTVDCPVPGATARIPNPYGPSLGVVMITLVRASLARGPWNAPIGPMITAIIVTIFSVGGKYVSSHREDGDNDGGDRRAHHRHHCQWRGIHVPMGAIPRSACKEGRRAHYRKSNYDYSEDRKGTDQAHAGDLVHRRAIWFRIPARRTSHRAVNGKQSFTISTMRVLVSMADTAKGASGVPSGGIHAAAIPVPPPPSTVEQTLSNSS
jgi:hypothetical protein